MYNLFSLWIYKCCSFSVKLVWVAINVNYRVMWYMIIKCIGFIYVNLIECFLVSSNVSLDLGLVCDEKLNIMDILRGVTYCCINFSSQSFHLYDERYIAEFQPFSTVCLILLLCFFYPNLYEIFIIALTLPNSIFFFSFVKKFSI